MKKTLLGKEAVNWSALVGTACNFKNPVVISPHKERGTIQGTNGLNGEDEQIIVTDATGVRFYIPVSMAGVMIEVLQG